MFKTPVAWKQTQRTYKGRQHRQQTFNTMGYQHSNTLHRRTSCSAVSVDHGGVHGISWYAPAGSYTQLQSTATARSRVCKARYGADPALMSNLWVHCLKPHSMRMQRCSKVGCSSAHQPHDKTYFLNKERHSLRIWDSALRTMSMGLPVKDMRRTRPGALVGGSGRSAAGSPTVRPAMLSARVLTGGWPAFATVSAITAVSAIEVNYSGKGLLTEHL